MDVRETLSNAGVAGDCAVGGYLAPPACSL